MLREQPPATSPDFSLTIDVVEYFHLTAFEMIIISDHGQQDRGHIEANVLRIMSFEVTKAWEQAYPGYTVYKENKKCGLIYKRMILNGFRGRSFCYFQNKIMIHKKAKIKNSLPLSHNRSKHIVYMKS